MKILRYIPAFNQVTGGMTSTILMLQLEYWFEKTSGKVFFKFLEPCEDPAYRPGDAWTEELGVSKAEFRHAFSKIGVAYKSKKAYRESKDKFQGKFYASYFDRIQRKTYYIRNTKKVEEAFRLVEAKESSVEPIEPILLEQSKLPFSEGEKVDLGGSEQLNSRVGLSDTHSVECHKVTVSESGKPYLQELGSRTRRSEEVEVPLSIDYYQENTYKDYRQEMTSENRESTQ